MAGKLSCLFGPSQKLQVFRPILSGLNARSCSDWKPKDEVTHTGQTFSDDDYRMTRFVDRTKLVNPNWSVKLINEVPPEPKKARVVSCDGGGGPLGHPKVYINLDKPGNHACGYCGLRFYKEDHHH